MGLEAGFSKTDITPGFPTCLACSQKKDTLFERIHDNIYVRCMILRHNGRHLMIMSYDLLFHSGDLTDFAYNHAGRLMNMEKSDVLINCTHDHNSPSTLGYNDHSASSEYERLLRDRTEKAIEDAFHDLTECTMEYGKVEGDWNINRRRPSDNGILLSPNPDGPRDRNMYVLKVSNYDNTVKGVLINYACHPVHYPDTLGLTSEYPGYLCRYIEDDLDGCTALFVQGAGADTRPLGTVEGDRFVHRSFEHIEKMALSMKTALMKKLNTHTFKKINPSFNSVSFSIDIPTDDEGRDYFLENISNSKISAHLRRNAEYVFENYQSLSDSFVLECGLIKLSDDLMIAHMGGEPVCEVKFAIEKILCDFDVIFAGYTDGCAYIVTDAMIDEDGYEVRCFLEYMHKGRIKKGIDSLIDRGFHKALSALK